MSNINKEEISKLFFDFGNKIKKLDKKGFQDLIDNGFEIIPKKSKSGKKESLFEIEKFNQEEFLSKLENCETRESGLLLFENNNLPKQILESLLKKLSIPIQKKDNIQIMKDKIIESTIGIKIRSKAIQGFNND